MRKNCWAMRRAFPAGSSNGGTWPDSPTSPILSLWSHGDVARRLEERGPQQAVEDAMQALRTAFGASVPQPVGSLATSWMADPFSRGAQQFLAVGRDLRGSRRPGGAVGRAALLCRRGHVPAATRHGPRRMALRPSRRESVWRVEFFDWKGALAEKWGLTPWRRLVQHREKRHRHGACPLFSACPLRSTQPCQPIPSGWHIPHSRPPPEA